MKTILIVDDLDVNRKLLIKLLKKINNKYTVIEAKNGHEAVSQYQKNNPDLVLMDVNMPKMNGYEAATIIKSHSDKNYVPIIFITALSSDNSLTHSLNSGGDDFISKPFQTDVLESKINAHLRIRALYLKIAEKNQQLTKYSEHLEYEQELIEHFFTNALNHSYLDPNIIKYRMSAMATFNGDIFLVERTNDGKLFLLMGDFTGHGLTASMGTLPVAMIFFNMIKNNATLNEIIHEMNLQLNKLMPPGLYLAANLIEFNSECHSITMWNGAMPESYLLSSSGKLKSEIHSNNMALGVFKSEKFKPNFHRFDVDQGDKIYLYSDGIVEAQNPEGDFFGNDRLKEIILNNNNNRFEAILNELNQFTCTDKQTDDITLVEMTCNKIPKKERINNITSSRIES